MRHLSFIVLLIASLSQAQVAGGPLLITRASRTRVAPPGLSVVRGGAPYNDLCQNAVIHALAPDGTILITGDNTGSTDTEDFGNPVSWEAFTIDTCSTVTVSYCGTDPLFDMVYSILIVGCPDFIANVLSSGTTDCSDGNVIITYDELAAGTYYIPVLRTAGAVGPYTLTVSSDVCDTPPVNDICANAELISVVQDCALGLVNGNNANTVINSAPPCATTSTQFQDVWYQFDSGQNSEVVITIDPGTLGDLGVEVRTACAGTSVFCAVGDTAYTVAVEPATNYRVRVFSNNDFGFGGTFGICVTVPPAGCHAGTISGPGGNEVIACSNGGDPIPFMQSGAVGSTTWLLTDVADTIIMVLDGPTLIPDGLEPGSYRVWAVAYAGELLGADPGLPLNGLSATGECMDLSVPPVYVVIEICQGLTDGPVADADLVVLQTTGGVVLRWQAEDARILVECFDPLGRTVVRRSYAVGSGQEIPMSIGGPSNSGTWVVRVVREGHAPLVKRVFVHGT